MNKIEIVSPVSLKKLYSIEEESHEHLHHIFSDSQKISKEIKSLSIKERVKLIKPLTKIITKNLDLILDRVIEETGKSRSDAIVGEIFTVLDTIDWINKNTHKILKHKKVKTPIAMMGKKSEIWYEPYGVAFIVSPWNYPVTQFFIPVLLAFVAGNAIIYKPSEHTPLKGLMEQLLEEANFPKKYIQIIYGSGITGQKIIEMRPDKIHFTGSARTGKKIMELASKLLIPIDLELGGKDPAIVFADANLKRTVAGTIWGSLTNTGQSCTSIERLYVERSIYDSFIKQLEEEILKLTLGVGENDDIGTMTPEFQIKIVQDHLEDAKNKGAKIITGGNRQGIERVLEPTLIVDVTPDMKIFTDETFGPVIAVVPFDSEEEVIKLANDSSYGLSATIWTKDIPRARSVADKLEVGNVCINNVMTNEGNPYLPFGGYKESGFGRLKGEVGLIGFCNVKSVLIDKSSDKLEVNWFPYTEKKYKLLRKFITSMYSTNPLKLINVLYRGLKLEREAQKGRK